MIINIDFIVINSLILYLIANINLSLNHFSDKKTTFKSGFYLAFGM